jgi:pimeloyl-ACP methyl ester carboxylesterase
MNNIGMSSLQVSIAAGKILNMRRFKGGDTPVLMCHGLMEDGRAFYGKDLRGLAHDIAMQGYDVFVPDWRNRGLPGDRVKPGREQGLFEWASQDLPSIIERIKAHNPAPCFVINQGWGGVVFSAMLARNPSLIDWVKGVIYLGTKREILSPTRFYKLGWAGALKLMVSMKGHIPARGLRIGRVNESARCYQDHLLYSQQQQWLDRQDGFDYSKFQLQLNMPPSLYFAGREDKYDVKAFMQTFSPHDGRLVVLNRSLTKGRRGGQRMYTKIKDQLPIILRWMNLHVG